ncbi:hypothetical protein MKA37_24145, partial [[Clostridium] innocuum]|nr:hypothetical protein [[Clostridium] innocuum]
HEAKIHFVRYADDFLLFAESEQEIERAGTVAREVISSLGLEIYYLNVYKAIEVLKRHDIEIHCLLQPMGTRLHAIDQYTRQRLR